jgi:hypothetical protein
MLARSPPFGVIPTKAGIDLADSAAVDVWTPAFAGVTPE